jgi:FdhD protein
MLGEEPCVHATTSGLPRDGLRAVLAELSVMSVLRVRPRATGAVEAIGLVDAAQGAQGPGWSHLLEADPDGGRDTARSRGDILGPTLTHASIVRVEPTAWSYAGAMGSTDRRRVTRVENGCVVATRGDHIAVEEPLEIIVDGLLASTTMRTPGHDVELALGWCVSEGIITGVDDLVTAKSCFTKSLSLEELAEDDDVQRVVEVVTTHRRPVTPRLHATSSACGICGSDVIATTLALGGQRTDPDATVFAPSIITAMPDAMRNAQRHFDSSGGMHAAALFDAQGSVLCVREDVGRHNAVDKVIGWAAQQRGLPLTGVGLQVSGRASAELAHKAIVAGIPLLSAVSAPTTLAVDLAREAGLTLVGFVRGDSVNIYSGEQRILDTDRIRS